MVGLEREMICFSSSVSESEVFCYFSIPTYVASRWRTLMIR